VSITLVEADGGEFLRATKRNSVRIHSPRLAALNDNIVARLLRDIRENATVKCGHLVFCEETALQGIALVQLGMYQARAMTARLKISDLAQQGIQVIAMLQELRAWGLYPKTEAAILMDAYNGAGDLPPFRVAVQDGIGVSPRGDTGKTPEYKPMLDYLKRSYAENVEEGESGDKRAYGLARQPLRPWTAAQWREAMGRIGVMNSAMTPTPVDQFALAQEFNGRLSLDALTGKIVLTGEDDIMPTIDVLFANQLAYEGIDLQVRTCALHHLDLPWEPATYTQRNGRAVRQGNLLGRVDIYVYVTDGTVDFYRLSRLNGRKVWLESVLAGTRASAALGGSTEEELKGLILACTLPEDRMDKVETDATGKKVVVAKGVKTRLDEQFALLFQRQSAKKFAQTLLEFGRLNVGCRIRSLLPLCMETPWNYATLDTNSIDVTSLVPLQSAFSAQQTALGELTGASTQAEKLFPHFSAMRDTAMVTYSTTPSGHSVERFAGGNEIDRLHGSGVSDFFLAGCAFQEFDDAGVLRHAGWFGLDDAVSVQSRDDDTIIGWGIDADFDLGGFPDTRLYPNARPGEATTPEVANTYVILCSDSPNYALGFPPLKDVPIRPINFDYSPLAWRDAERDALRTAFATDTLVGYRYSRDTVYEIFRGKGGSDYTVAPYSLPAIDYALTNTKTGEVFKNMGKTWDSYEKAKKDIDAGLLDVAPSMPRVALAMEATAVLGALFFESAMMRLYPTEPRMERGPLGQAVDSIHAALARGGRIFDPGTEGGAVYDSATVTAEGVKFNSVVHSDDIQYSGAFRSGEDDACCTFANLTQFYDAVRLGAVRFTEDWPYESFLRVFIVGAITDAREYAALIRSANASAYPSSSSTRNYAALVRSRGAYPPALLNAVSAAKAGITPSSAVRTITAYKVLELADKARKAGRAMPVIWDIHGGYFNRIVDAELGKGGLVNVIGHTYEATGGVASSRTHAESLIPVFSRSPAVLKAAIADGSVRDVGHFIKEHDRGTIFTLVGEVGGQPTSSMAERNERLSEDKAQAVFDEVGW
jgi:hypothetical protein